MGMHRRLSIAIACIGNPDILILDEPCAGLDPSSQREVWEVIERVREGRTMILTTDAIERAEHLCNRIGKYLFVCILSYLLCTCIGTY